MLKFPIGIQLYSVRDEVENDFEGTLRKLKAMGYNGVELVGLYNREPAEIKRICTEIGLTPLSVLVGVEDIMNWSEKTMVQYKETGCRQVVLSYLPTEYRYGTKNFELLMNKLREMGEYGRTIGLPIAYHNHDFEFEKVDEEYVLDKIYREIGPEILRAELDTCWIHVGGENPSDYIRKYAGRMFAVHLKDYQVSGDCLDIAMCPVGQGSLNFVDIIRASEEADAKWLVVEQDYPSKGMTTLECARMSIEYLKSL